jgi:hypothetical protein
MHGESTLTKEEITALLKLDGMACSVKTSDNGKQLPFQATIYKRDDLVNGIRFGYKSHGYGQTREEAMNKAFNNHNFYVNMKRKGENERR